VGLLVWNSLRLPKRYISTPIFHPMLFKDQTLNEVSSGILKCLHPDVHLPLIPIPLKGSQVSILTEPRDFYDKICEGIAQAKSSIVLASLYIGRGPDANHIIDLIDRACSENPEIKVTFLMDYLRGTRSGHPKHWRKSKKGIFRFRSRVHATCDEIRFPASSVSQLLPLLKTYPKNIRAFFYHTPELGGILERIVPQPFNETVGVQHMKFYCFDDNVIVSGANLEDNYFINRLDRYAYFRSTSLLSQYYSGLADTIAKFSYYLEKDGNLLFNPTLNLVSHTDSRFKTFAQQAVEKYSNDFANTLPLYKNIEADTLAIMSLQMAQINIRQDQRFTEYLLKSLSKHGWNTFWTSPYFNLTRSFREAILNSSGEMQILVAAPQANGFYFGKGLLPCIPSMYAHLLQQFYTHLKNSSRDKSVTLFEWMKADWTYHGKGMWWTGVGETEPAICNIGSSNYGVRSINRDLESQITIITESPFLRDQLKKETENLKENQKVVTEETFLEKDYQVKGWLKFLTKFLAKYM
jgi:CDP-diacylglycerol---glycerol-3-phosphate 3-phosphatidyltransferase